MSDVSIISGHLLAFCPGRSILGISVPNITASRGSCGAVAACYVRPGGLEPPRPKTLDPKSNAATNYATGANVPQRYDFFLNCRPLCDGVWMLSHTAESAEPNNRLSRQLHIRTAIDVFALNVLVLQKIALPLQSKIEPKRWFITSEKVLFELSSFSKFSQNSLIDREITTITPAS